MKSLALVFVAFTLQAQAKVLDCGHVDGGLNARIANCAKLPDSQKTSSSGVVWNLVSRQTDPVGEYHDQMEVWQDAKTGLLWGDRINKNYSQYDAVNLSNQSCVTDEENKAVNCAVEKETACVSEDAKIANAAITEKTFALPTIQEFIQADADGFRDVTVHNVSSWYWTTSISSFNTGSARVFSGEDGDVTSFYREASDDQVRCVAR